MLLTFRNDQKNCYLLNERVKIIINKKFFLQKHKKNQICNWRIPNSGKGFILCRKSFRKLRHKKRGRF